MYTRTTPIKTPQHLLAYEKYTRNRTHQRHWGVIVGERYYLGQIDGMKDEAIMDEWIRMAEKRNGQVTRGPKSKTLVRAIIMHTPVDVPRNARLTATERDFICHRAHQLIGGNLIADFHVGPRRDVDIHFLSDRTWPRTERAYLAVRKIFDRIHLEINQQRDRLGRPPLPTMEQVRKQKKEEKKIISLTDQLTHEGTVTRDNLVEVLTRLGHRIGPKGMDERYVHVIHPGGRKAWAYRIDRLLGLEAEATTTTAVVPPAVSVVTPPVTPWDPQVFQEKIRALGYELGPRGIQKDQDTVDLIHPATRDRKADATPEGMAEVPYTLRDSPRPLVEARQTCSVQELWEDLIHVPSTPKRVPPEVQPEMEMDIA